MLQDYIVAKITVRPLGLVSRHETRKCKLERQRPEFQTFKDKVSILFGRSLAHARFYYIETGQVEVAFSSDEELGIAFNGCLNNELEIHALEGHYTDFHLHEINPSQGSLSSSQTLSDTRSTCGSSDCGSTYTDCAYHGHDDRNPIDGRYLESSRARFTQGARSRTCSTEMLRHVQSGYHNDMGPHQQNGAMNPGRNIGLSEHTRYGNSYSVHPMHNLSGSTNSVNDGLSAYNESVATSTSTSSRRSSSCFEHTADEFTTGSPPMSPGATPTWLHNITQTDVVVNCSGATKLKEIPEIALETDGPNTDKQTQTEDEPDLGSGVNQSEQQQNASFNASSSPASMEPGIEEAVQVGSRPHLESSVSSGYMSESDVTLSRGNSTFTESEAESSIRTSNYDASDSCGYFSDFEEISESECPTSMSYVGLHRRLRSTRRDRSRNTNKCSNDSTNVNKSNNDTQENDNEGMLQALRLEGRTSLLRRLYFAFLVWFGQEIPIMQEKPKCD